MNTQPSTPFSPAVSAAASTALSGSPASCDLSVTVSYTHLKKALDILECGEAFPKAPEATPIIEDKKDDGKEKRTAQAGSFVEDPTRCV